MGNQPTQATPPPAPHDPRIGGVDYDFEFVDYGHQIAPISIGMCCADTGREYYAIVRDHRTITDAVRDPWLRANVVPSLPLLLDEESTPIWWDWDNRHHDYAHVKPLATVAREVRAFLQATPDLRLWAYFAAYDHVALAQLFGRMTQLPGGVPMFTNDIAQEAQRLGFGTDSLPPQPSGLHNSLADARHNRVRREFLARRAADLGRS